MEQCDLCEYVGSQLYHVGSYYLCESCAEWQEEQNMARRMILGGDVYEEDTLEADATIG